MAKKKFLNLDNMNILWDSIDRNFLRREDIPYTEFDELLTESNTIIGAINELYRLIGEGISPVYPSIACSTSSITENYQAITKTVTATYKDYLKINEPQVTGGTGWLTVTKSGSGGAMTYNIALSENNGSKRTGTIVLSCTGKNGNAQHTITVTQNGIGDATITVDNFPSTLSDHTAFSRSGYYVSYSNWSSINKPTSDSSWLTIKEVSGNTNKCEYQISVTENTSSQRSAKLTFSCVGKNGKTISKTHTITQPEAGAATISFSPNPIDVDWNADEATVQVTYSNYKDILTPTEACEWINSIQEVTHSGNTYTYNILGIQNNKNTQKRTAKLKFGCNNLLGSPVYAEVSLEQDKAPAGTLVVTPTSKTIAAAGGNITFTVTFSNTEYYWVDDVTEEWITLPGGTGESNGSTSKSYTVTVAANTGASRTCTLRFNCHGHDSQDKSVLVTITQSGKTLSPASISVNPTSWSVAANGGTKNVTVTYSGATSYDVSSNQSWLTTSKSGNTVTLTAAANTSTSSRTATVTYSCVGEDGNTKKATTTVTQAEYVDDTPEVDTLPMYIGYVPDPEYKINSYSDITSNMILNGVTKGEIVKSDASAVSKAGFGDVPAESFLLIALPQNSGLSAVKWVEALQVESPFTVDPLVNGEVSVNIDGETYSLYGQLTPYKLIKDTKEIHYRIK